MHRAATGRSAPRSSSFRPARSISGAAALLFLFAACGGGGADAPAAPAVLADLTGRWSDPDTWAPAAIPAAGDDVTIPAGKVVYLDAATAPLGDMVISGQLIADPQVDVSLTAASILVPNGGLLQIGSDDRPYTRRATITLTGARSAHTARTEDTGLDNDGKSRGLRVMMGGSLVLVGATSGPQRAKLNAHAPAQSDTFTLATEVSWKAGDRIAISLTDFHGTGETEILTLAEDAQATQIRTTTPIASSRWGLLQYPIDAAVDGSAMSLTQGAFTPASAATPTVLDERAEVVNLTRRIVVQGADDADWNNQGFGAHVMVMGRMSTARVDGIEFRRCGQRQAMGRYPFHWHMLSYTEAEDGQGGGTYLGDVMAGDHRLANCAIWDSENRAVTVHGTCGVTVSNTYAVDIAGHAFFLEDGGERRNTVDGCVAMKVRDPDANRMKRHDRFASGFWITNPDNTITNNVASDCDGKGVWNTFARRCFGLSRNIDLDPSSLQIALHEGNTGHSNGEEGIATDLAVVDEAGNIQTLRYDPGVAFTLSNNVTWKNRTGGYLNRTGQPQYIGWTMADNSGIDFRGATMSGARLQDSLLIGSSLNNETPFDEPRRRAFASYHHAMDIIDITAVNYPFAAPAMTPNGQFVYGGGVMDSADLYIEGVALGGFRNTGWRMINSNAGFLSPPPYFDGFPLQVGDEFRHWSVAGAIWDPHGYWGPAGNYLVPDEPFYTHALSSSVAVAPADSNGRSTPDVFFGLDEIRPDYDADPWTGGQITVRCDRLDTNNTVVGHHLIGDPDVSIFFPIMRSFALARGGRYQITFPGELLPTSSLTVNVRNAYRTEDEVVLALPWDGTVPVKGRQDSGLGRTEAHAAQGQVRIYSATGTSLTDVLNDSSGQTIWQDSANNLVWIKYKGGLVRNVYDYDGRNDASLEQLQIIRLMAQ